MTRKAIWLLLSFLTALIMALSACAPKPPAGVAPKETAPKETAPTGAAPKETAPAPVTGIEVVVPKGTPGYDVPEVNPPKYGGTIVTVDGSAVGFPGNDQVVQKYTIFAPPMTLVYEDLLTGDWTRGPAGTGETAFTGSWVATEGFFTEKGAIAESWEIPDDQTLRFKIRKGIFWQTLDSEASRLLNGRELTPADVLFNLKRMYLNPAIPLTYNVQTAFGGYTVKDIYIDPDDPRTVVVKVNFYANAALEDVGDKVWITAPEVINKYGDTMNWRNHVGTGPFIITNFVSASSLTFVRNPKYWETDPVGVGKGNQLPYVDGINYLIIPDKTTMLTALRTYKIDWMTPLNWEDVDAIKNTNPEIWFKRDPNRVEGMGGIAVRVTSTDPRAIPVQNLRVRQALNMAINKEAILRDYYGGNGFSGAMIFYPGNKWYTTMDQKVEILQRVHGLSPQQANVLKMMYEYHPEEAKKILAEEGYPNGFKTTVLAENTAENSDLLSIIAGDWKKNLNIDMEIDLKERATYTSITNSFKTPALLTGGAYQGHRPDSFLNWSPATMEGPRGTINTSDFKETKINAAIQKVNDNYGKYEWVRDNVLRDIEPYMMLVGPYIQIPVTWNYIGWQPWLRNNYGTRNVGYQNHYVQFKYAWLDLDLKEKITGRR